MDWASRYDTPITALFSRQHKLHLEHRVELALLRAHAELGRVPMEAYTELKAAVDGACARRSGGGWACGALGGRARAARSWQGDARTHARDRARHAPRHHGHGQGDECVGSRWEWGGARRGRARADFFSAPLPVLGWKAWNPSARCAGEQSEKYGGYVHLGATSQDINDTVMALQLDEARASLLRATARVRWGLTRLAVRHRDLASIGRTHGQHAIPITMGFKFANFLYELSVAEGFLRRVALLGKFSGAVGTFAAVGGSDALMRRVLSILGVAPVPISTQVVSRLHVADYCFGVVGIAAALERLARELRNLQRTEIGETSEGFGAKQVGSSTMPQKRNPHKSERVCGIARVVRAQLAAVVETVPLEHERDLTNSSVERIALATALGLTHFAASEMAAVVKDLRVHEDAVRRNLALQGGRAMSERVMMALADKIGRQEAHEILRLLSKADGDFAAALKADARVAAVLSPADVDALLDPATYIGRAQTSVDEIVAAYGLAAEPEADPPIGSGALDTPAASGGGGAASAAE
jgi:adenylosuccinate lyase